MHVTKQRAIRIMNHTRYQTCANDLFFKSNILKFMEMVKLKTAQLLFKARNYLF